MADQVKFSRYETEEVGKQSVPQRETRSQGEKEKAPDYYNRQAEKEGRSTWSGSWAGGRSR